MLTAPLPANEAQRLAEVQALGLLDTPPEERFDRIVDLASKVFDVPIAYIALIDADRQWLKAQCGLTIDETGRDISFCGHAIAQHGPLIVPDTLRDQRFADNPLVTSEPYVRFYAGYPLRGPNGPNVGTLCLADQQPRRLSARQRKVFDRLAAIAEHELQMMDVIEAQNRLIDTQRQLVTMQQRLRQELDDAAAFVRTKLPQPIHDGPVRADYHYIASSQLGGDTLGFHRLNEHQWAIFIIDVCGHGIASSLLSTSVLQRLEQHHELGVDPADPNAVLQKLNQLYPMEDNDGRFFTAWYGVYDANSRSLRYAIAGHHPALLVPQTGAQPQVTARSSQFMIGVMPDLSFEVHALDVPAGARLYLFSDGAFELTDDDGRMLNYDGLTNIIAAANRNGAADRLQDIADAVRAHQGGDTFDDDYTMLEVEFA